MSQPNVPIVNAGALYVNGLELSFDLGVKTFNVNAGACRDSSNVNDIVVSLPVVVNGLKVGPNGMDSAPIASEALYAVYAIGDSSNYNPGAVICSTNFVQPYLPAGYDMYRRIGWAAANSSVEWQQWYQYGADQSRQYWYAVAPKILNAGTATVFTPVFAVIPPVECPVTLLVQYISSADGHFCQFQPFADTAVNGIAAFGGGKASAPAAQVSTIVVPSSIDPTDNAPKFLYKVAAGDSIDIYTVGFWDYL